MEKEPKESFQARYHALKKEYDEFTYIVSHDLRAPLRAISNLSAWISEDLGEDIHQDVKKNFALLQNRVERMEGMINALLELSRIEHRDLETYPVRVKDIVDQSVLQLKPLSNLVVHSENLPEFTTFQHKLETVFYHLLRNAVLFNENPTPEIWINSKLEGAYYVFSLKDNGVGISEEAQQKIFTLFYTIQPKDKFSSVGSGLTIVRKILDVVGGKLMVRSSPGKGSVFSFTWPLVSSLHLKTN